ncbi:hypothetical protein AB6A40_004031 [Gnathostoma spinigerum]|uniref:Uncharacterized protein n=1 Tax=Gnathostoma spinigerum TaxID=75299 RepID=A0ABD6EDH5_9BILA
MNCRTKQEPFAVECGANGVATAKENGLRCGKIAKRLEKDEGAKWLRMLAVRAWACDCERFVYWPTMLVGQHVK